MNDTKNQCVSQRPDGDPEGTEALIEAREHGSTEEIRKAEERVVVECLPVAAAVARRYRRRGVDVDDLEQVARLGLIKAVRRWRPERGNLLGYLMPTINGEVKRYFRDTGTVIRIPRSLYEAQPRVTLAQRALRQQLSREPRTAEIARETDLSDEMVRKVLRASGACQPLSTDDDADWIGRLASDSADQDLSMATVRAELRPVIASLTARERHIVALRFIWGYSQLQIARSLGVSQMQISRLLRSILGKLREGLDPAPRAA